MSKAALESARATIGRLGVEALAVPTDVSDEAAVQALAAAALERCGSVALVCNNAGVASKADTWVGPISAWHWVLGVILWGVIHCVRAFIPIMMAQSERHIVNTPAWRAWYPVSVRTYDASKHAVVALTEDLCALTKMIGLSSGS